MKNKIIKFVRQRYFTIVNLILITVFVGISIGTMYDFLATITDNSAVSSVDVKKYKTTTFNQTRKKTLASYDNVVKRNIFKTASLTEVIPENSINPDDLDNTELNLKLWGTIVAGKEFSSAIIEETKTKKQQLYKIGDTIETAKLTHILRNKVVLTVNGKDEILEMENNAGNSVGRKRDSLLTSSDTDSTPSRDISVNRSLIDESMKDLNKLMKDVRIRPHFRNGESDGLIVSGIKGGSVFRKLGLRNGDIIMGVDGSKIESVDDAMKLYSGLSDLQKMKVDIKRRGKIQTLNFNIE